MTKIIIYFILIYIIFLLISKIYQNYKYIEKFNYQELAIDNQELSIDNVSNDLKDNLEDKLEDKLEDNLKDNTNKLILNKITENIINKEENNDLDWLEELFDFIQIITIPSRIDHVKKFCESFNLKEHIFNAILIKDIKYNNAYNLKIGEIACALSQQVVLQNFINSKTNSLLLLEDDNLPFTHSFYKEIGLKLNYIQYYISSAVKSLPDNWDVLYLGRCWDDCNSHIPINNFIVKTKRTLCHHAIAFSKKGAKIILENISHPLDMPIDHIVAKLTFYNKINSYATILPLFYQNRAELHSSIGNYDHLPICG
jgi:GR25 family glycosyltransferase involved in LPS biosynthesis